jgi:hypothetical protein
MHALRIDTAARMRYGRILTTILCQDKRCFKLHPPEDADSCRYLKHLSSKQARPKRHFYSVTMPTLIVPGADLHYEVVGNGPMLLAIHGGDGSGEIWRGFSEGLQDRFTVVFYDRTCIPTRIR